MQESGFSLLDFAKGFNPMGGDPMGQLMQMMMQRNGGQLRGGPQMPGQAPSAGMQPMGLLQMLQGMGGGAMVRPTMRGLLD